MNLVLAFRRRGWVDLQSGKVLDVLLSLFLLPAFNAVYSLTATAQSALQSGSRDIRPLLKAYQPEEGVDCDCVLKFRDRRRRLGASANMQQAQSQPSAAAQGKSRFIKSFR